MSQVFEHTFENGKTVLFDYTPQGTFLLPDHCDHEIETVEQLRENIANGIACHLCVKDPFEDNLTTDKKTNHAGESFADNASSLKNISSNLTEDLILRIPEAFNPPQVARELDMVDSLIEVMRSAAFFGFPKFMNERDWKTKQRDMFTKNNLDLGILELFRNDSYAAQREYFINFDFSGGENKDMTRTKLWLGRN
jgi:hypothetical protein